jgi:ribonucleoside-diphosphate reductase alpha chain
MRWLASRFLDADAQEELGILTAEVRARKSAEDAASSLASDTAEPPAAAPATPAPDADANAGAGASAASAAPTAPRPATDALTDTPPVVPARLTGLDLGPACSQCGGMMQRTGSCYTCSSCGNNTGCG